MTRRLDLYGECNLAKAPMEEFTASCCSRCINPDCSRSQYGTSHFDQRVTNWYDNFFANVPRMSPTDPRYEKLAAQDFVLVQPALHISSGWDSPVPAPAPRPDPKPNPAPVAAAPTPSPAPEAAPEPETPKPTQRLATINTPAKQGQMIGTPPPKPAQNWDGPTAAPQPDAQVVKPGTKIQF